MIHFIQWNRLTALTLWLKHLLIYQKEVNSMAKTLELQFATEMGGTARITVDNPKDPIETATIKQSMEQINTSGVFYSPTGNLVAKKGARVVERDVTDYEMV
jgi:hypothetical protein